MIVVILVYFYMKGVLLSISMHIPAAPLSSRALNQMRNSRNIQFNLPAAPASPAASTDEESSTPRHERGIGIQYNTIQCNPYNLTSLPPHRRFDGAR